MRLSWIPRPSKWQFYMMWAVVHTIGRMSLRWRYGISRILSDRALVDRLWSATWKVWFPDGKADPELCLLEVSPTAAEYWDQKGGKGLAYLFEAAKAYVQGGTPETNDEQHAKVRI